MFTRSASEYKCRYRRCGQSLRSLLEDLIFMESLYTHNSVTTAQFVTNRLQRESVWNSHLESEKHKKNLRVWNPLYRTPNRLFEEETTAPNTTTRKQREHKKDEIQAQHTIP